jgi:hypothetical protein
MSKVEEQYRERFKPVDIRLKSGFLARVFKMTAEHWGPIAGGLLTLPQTIDGTSSGDPALEAAKISIDQQAQYRKNVYEHLFLGFVDEESGEVWKPEYSEAGADDVTEIVEWQFTSAPNRGPLAEAVGRSL